MEWSHWYLLAFLFVLFAAVVAAGAIGSTRPEAIGKLRRHVDRLRAVESASAQDRALLTWPAAVVCLGLGVAVPVGAMLTAWLAAMTTRGNGGELFGWAALVGCVGIGAAVYLARWMMTFAAGYWIASGRSEPVATAQAKPVADPDAYDFVGSRG